MATLQSLDELCSMHFTDASQAEIRFCTEGLLSDVRKVALYRGRRTRNIFASPTRRVPHPFALFAEGWEA